jgi:hypothetical protein
MASGGDDHWDDPSYWSEPAEQAFAKAHGKALRENLFDRIRGRPLTLLSFDDHPGRPHMIPSTSERAATVELRDIVGSVGKSPYFTRSFKPRSPALKRRWKSVYALVNGLRGYEPIELYEVDNTFYVVDGHNRVSVARQLGHDTIQANVRHWS